MFEQIIDRWRQNIILTIDQQNDFIYLPEILSNDKVELFIKIYLTAEINWWIYQEKIIRESNNNFDFTAPEFKELNKQYERTLFNNAKFSRDNLNILINNGVKIHLNFTCRPRTTLKWFIFRNEPTKSFEELSLRMKYFLGYDYLIDKLFRCEEILKSQLNNSLIGAVEFERLVEKYDNEALYEMTPSEFIVMLEDLFYYFDSENQNKIPVSALIIFFDDKGLDYIAQKLDNKFKSLENEFITRKDFQDFLFSLIQNFQPQIVDDIIVIPEPTVPYREVIEYNDSKKLFGISQEKIDEKLQGKQNIESETKNFDESSIDEDDFEADNIATKISDIDEKIDFDEDDFLPLHILKDSKEEEIGFEDFDFDFLSEKNTVKSKESHIKDKDTVTHFETKEKDNNGFLQMFEIETSIPTSFILFDDKFPAEVITAEYDYFIAKSDAINMQGDNKQLYEFDSNAISQEVDTVELDKLFDHKLNDKFVKRIFHHNKQEYLTFLKTIRNLTSWKDIAVKIDLLYSHKSIDPDSSIAKEFRNAIQSKLIL